MGHCSTSVAIQIEHDFEIAGIYLSNLRAFDPPQKTKLSSTARMSARPTALDDFPPDAIEFLRSGLREHDYDMHEIIGRGGFSVVFRVHSRRFDDDFAAKITNTSSTRHKTADRAPIFEEQSLRAMDHPHIVRLYDSFTMEPYSILILELCTSTSLLTLIGQSHGEPIPKLRSIMSQLADAVLFVHAHGYVHRDIKPENVLLDTYGRPKLADFGMCIKWNESELIDDHCGSWRYRAPEMYEGPFNPYKADIWALGVTFYEMTMGMIQWPGDTVSEKSAAIRDGGILINPATPHDVAKLVRAMTELNPETRPPASAIRRAAPSLRSEPLRSSVSMILRRPGDDKRRRRAGTPGPATLLMVPL
jgi:serine/threonine protein kinase